MWDLTPCWIGIKIKRGESYSLRLRHKRVKFKTQPKELLKRNIRTKAQWNVQKKKLHITQGKSVLKRRSLVTWNPLNRSYTIT